MSVVEEPDTVYVANSFRSPPLALDTAALTNASVATSAVLSPRLCVVPVVPFGRAVARAQSPEVVNVPPVKPAPHVTLVTDPPPAVAHVPSPRRKVLEVAPAPPNRSPTPIARNVGVAAAPLAGPARKVLAL